MPAGGKNGLVGPGRAERMRYINSVIRSVSDRREPNELTAKSATAQLRMLRRDEVSSTKVSIGL